jgi:hypothetical protein
LTKEFTNERYAREAGYDVVGVLATADAAAQHVGFAALRREDSLGPDPR